LVNNLKKKPFNAAETPVLLFLSVGKLCNLTTKVYTLSVSLVIFSEAVAFSLCQSKAIKTLFANRFKNIFNKPVEPGRF
jgi:hypothetical protein